MIRFGIVGSGWRSLFYVRVAKAFPEKLELLALLCRSREKAERIAREQGIRTLYREQELAELKPDFIVSAVDKASMNEVCCHWLDMGFAVLSETPCGLEKSVLDATWKRCVAGAKLQVAEQYCHYPYYAALIKTVESGMIGEPVSVTISAMHDYHAVSVIRHLLQVGTESVKITGKTFQLPVTETKTRYEILTEGKVVPKEEKHLILEFAGGKVAFYDFMSEQYRSEIRKPFVNVRGTRGEIFGEEVRYLDAENLPQVQRLEIVSPYRNLGLSQDETAIAKLLFGMSDYLAGGREVYPMKEALEDSYLAILMTEAGEHAYRTVETGAREWQ